MEPKVLQNSDSEAESISEHILSNVDTSDNDNTHPSNSVSDKQEKRTPDKIKISLESSWPESSSKSDHLSTESSPQLKSGASDQIPSPKSDSNKTDEDPPLVRDSLERLIKSKKNSSTSDDKSQDGATNKSSSSEEIIKLDIRGTAAPKFDIPFEQIIIGPPPPEILSFPLLPTEDNVKKCFFPSAAQMNADLDTQIREEKYFDSIESNRDESGQITFDRLIEEMTVDNSICKDDPQVEHKSDVDFTPLSTMSTDYKTICEEYYTKLTKLEKVLAERETVIQELSSNLQRTQTECRNIHEHNTILSNMVDNLRQKYGDAISSESDLMKENLSDFMKNESMIRGDNSTKYFSAIMSSGNNSEESSRTVSIHSDKDVEADEVLVNYSHSSPETVKICDDEISKLFLDLPCKIPKAVINTLKEEIERYCKNQLKELQTKHQKDMENLRMYFERKCQDMEKNYSEEVSASAVSAEGCDSLDVCAALALSSPLRTIGDVRARSRSVDTLHDAQSNETKEGPDYEQEIEKLKTEHLSTVSDLVKRHNKTVEALRDQIVQMKAHIQTAQNTENLPTFVEDIDLVLEKGVQVNNWEQQLHEAKQEAILLLQDQIKALLSDPDAEVTSWPQELVALRDRIHTDAHQTIAKMKQQYEEELSTLRAELGGATSLGAESCSSLHWRQRRNSSFDKNRQLEEVTKERDGLKQMTLSLQHIVAYLIQYFSDCENEINKTVLADIALAANALDITLESKQCTPDSSFAVNERRVHIAPDLSSLLTEEAIEQIYKEQRDISLEVRRELEMSLNRLKQEADELLQISTRVAAARKSLGPPAGTEGEEVKIDDDLRSQENPTMKELECENCRAQRKELEDVLTESFDREMTLRKELESAKLKLSQLASDVHEDIFIAEGVGTALPPLVTHKELQLNTTWSPRSLDSPRLHQLNELEAIARERDDLIKQLEAANRQLRASRAFVEEQAVEREVERDDFTQKLQQARSAAADLKTKLQLAHGDSQHAENLEGQLKEMSTLVQELESKNSELNNELKSSSEKIIILRDIICNLETQLEAKTQREGEIIRQLEEMRRTIDERDEKLRMLVGELENLKVEAKDMSRHSTPDRSDHSDYDIEKQLTQIVSYVRARAAQLERAAAAPAPAGAASASEDISPNKVKVPPSPQCMEPPTLCGPLTPLSEVLLTSWRAECVALKALADHRHALNALKEIAQEVRAERDVLQSRMSEQALRISDLTARLQRQRESAQALRDEATADLAVKLHDALADNERLMAQTHVRGSHDQILHLEKILEEYKGKIAILQHEIREKDQYIRDILSLKLRDDDNTENKNNSTECNDAAKNSARTLSDIISLSEFDEQDMQMRRAEQKLHGISLDGVPYPNIDDIDRTIPAKTQVSFVMEKNSLDHLDLANFTTPRDKSKVTFITSTVTKHFKSHDTPPILENCSMFPNRLADETEQSTPGPKKINFSNLDQSQIENQIADIFKDLNIEGADMTNLPNAILKLKEEIVKLRRRLTGDSIVKAELDELRETLSTTLQNIQTDKEFFDNKLKSHLESEKELKIKLNDKDADLKLIKEDLVRRENTIIELAREKRNLQAKLEEFEVECDTLRRLEHEKNLQIDGLNSHLNRLDNLQRQVDIQSESMNDLLNKMQIVKCERDDALSSKNIMSEKLTKVEKELENFQQKYKDVVKEVEQLSAALGNALEDTKKLTDQVRDKDCQIQILNEDTVAFHEELDSLRRQLNVEQHSSPRSPGSPKSSRLSKDKKELVRIRKQVSLMQQELTYNKKELNEKVFDLERLKLDLNELKNELGRAQRRATELQDTLQNRDQQWRNNEQALQKKESSLQNKERQLQELIKTVEQQMEGKQRELQNELHVRYQELQDRERLLDQLHNQLQDLEEENAELRRNIVNSNEERTPLVTTTTRQRALSPTAELERSLKRELNASRRLDTSLAILLSPERTSVPKLLLPSRSSSARSSPGTNTLARYIQPNAAEQLAAESERLAAENDRLAGECERAAEERARLAHERDFLAARTHALQTTVAELQTAMENAQVEDQNTIVILKQRLEAALQSEDRVREELTSVRLRLQTLKSSLQAHREDSDSPFQIQMDTQARENVRLESEVSLLRNKLEKERKRISELQTEMHNERMNKLQADQKTAQMNALNEETPQSVQQLTQATRFLHSRCLRLESCRKGLVWQKRFLIKSLEGYTKVEKKLNLPKDNVNRFKCVALCVVAFVRMTWLVRRHRNARTLSRNTLLTSQPLTKEFHTLDRASLRKSTLRRSSSQRSENITTNITPKSNSRRHNRTVLHYNKTAIMLKDDTQNRGKQRLLVRDAMNGQSQVSKHASSGSFLHSSIDKKRKRQGIGYMNSSIRQSESDSSGVNERLGRVNRKLNHFLESSHQVR